MAAGPVRILNELLETAPGSWLVGHRLRLFLYSTPPQNQDDGVLCSWNDDEGRAYTLYTHEATQSLSSTTLVPRTLEPVYLAGPGSAIEHAVWDLGDAFLKIIDQHPPDVTREHVTLDWVNKKRPTFNIPKVLYHGEWEGRYYLIVTKVPGVTLNELWLDMSEELRARCVARVVEIYEEQAAWHEEKLQGVDGGSVCETHLRKGNGPNFDTSVMLNVSKELSMDVTTFHFHHCDMGPTNLLYDQATDRMSVIDWECAGFMPKQWIRIKYRVSGGMDLDRPGAVRHDFTGRVQAALGEKGFDDVALPWMDWFRS